MDVFLALAIMIIPTVLFFGIRVIAANIVGSKAESFGLKRSKWEFIAFMLPLISLLIIFMLPLISLLIIYNFHNLQKRNFMRILGWILIVIGGLLSVGFIIFMDDSDFVLDGSNMWIILITVIVVYVIYLITKDYKEEVRINVTNQGGMQEKYRVLLGYLTDHPNSRIVRLTKDHVSVSSPIMTFFIDYVGGYTEVEVKGIMPTRGNFSRKWKFPRGYSQENMIQEIESYFDWMSDSLSKIDNDDFTKYIN